jgi:hypothetical protein
MEKIVNQSCADQGYFLSDPRHQIGRPLYFYYRLDRGDKKIEERLLDSMANGIEENLENLIDAAMLAVLDCLDWVEEGMSQDDIEFEPVEQEEALEKSSIVALVIEFDKTPDVYQFYILISDYYDLVWEVHFDTEIPNISDWQIYCVEGPVGLENVSDMIYRPKLEQSKNEITEFTASDYWKGIVLFGLNAATYKMALGKCILKFAKSGQSKVLWEELATSFYEEYHQRLLSNPTPQQATPGRLTKLERIVQDEISGRLTRAQAIERVGLEGFNDVVPRFHTIGQDPNIAKDRFYDTNFGNSLELKDSILRLGETDFDELIDELDARWCLLEGAFSITHTHEKYKLANDIREIYLQEGYERTPLTHNIPFLNGYQGNVCFYCGEELGNDVHVDHVLPRQIINHDEVWNLVLSHGHCNLQKSDRIVGPHFIEKLIARNENIMGSNHPWKRKIEALLGSTSKKRASSLRHHYELVETARGSDYWGGSQGYNPENDPFYRRLVTVLNNH